ncbi:MAG: sugar phosphate isomerase/epimerase family protein [Cyclobacteriaceae bacterium]
MKGPAVYVLQFMGDNPPFDNLKNICTYMAELGYKGVQLPIELPNILDLDKIAESQDYADEIKGTVQEAGVEITELGSHLTGQLVAVHPAYDKLFDGFAADKVKGNPKARTEWAIDRMKKGAVASRRLGLNAMVSFSGSLLWPYMYPWPQRAPGLVDEGFKELAERWLPILNTYDENGVDVCYELHPGEDLHDGITFERFLAATNNHKRVAINYDPSHYILQQLDYIQHIDIYHEYIKAFHVKDAEYNPTGKSGVYGGFQDWVQRPGRFRSLGDGQVDFSAIFSKLTEYDYDSWAVLEWECCLKNAEDGAAEGAPFIASHLIKKPDRAFDDFAGSGTDVSMNREILGLE